MGMYNQILDIARQKCLQDYFSLGSSSERTAWCTFCGAVASVDKNRECGTHTPAVGKHEFGAGSRKWVAENAVVSKAAPSAKCTTEQNQQHHTHIIPQESEKSGRASGHHFIWRANIEHDLYKCQEQW